MQVCQTITLLRKVGEGNVRLELSEQLCQPPDRFFGYHEHAVVRTKEMQVFHADRTPSAFTSDRFSIRIFNSSASGTSSW